jgi:hypothetical protein
MWLTSLAPMVRIAARVKAGENLNFPIPKAEEQAIGKAMESRSPSVIADDGKVPGITGKAVQQGFKLVEETRSDAGCLGVVPVQRRDKVGLGRGRQDNAH